MMNSNRWIPAVLTCLLLVLPPSSPPALATPQSEGVAMGLEVVGLRLLLGVDDKEPSRWDGSVRLSGGEVLRVEGWRFRPNDEIVGQAAWRASSHRLTQPRRGTPRMSPTGVVLTLRIMSGTRLEVHTAQGDFRVPLDAASLRRRLRFLNGRVVADRVVAGTQITSSATENDFPSVAAAADGTLWVAFVRHSHRGPADLQSFQTAPEDFRFLVPQGGGDQVALIRFDGGRWSEPIAVTDTERDIWRPAVAVDASGRVRVVWSQNDNGNWDLFEQAYDPQRRTFEHDRPRRLTTDLGADVYVAMATDGLGRPWVAWQAWRGGQADIWLTQLGASPQAARAITKTPSNEWSPAIAVDARNRVHVAYDTYEAGNYDVYVRTLAGDKLGEPIGVATSARFEARPSVVCDAENRVWVAYEQRAANWGKDFGPLSPVEGSPLYMRGSSVQVRCVVDGRLMQPIGQLMAALPDDLKGLNSYPRLGIDGDGRLWVVFRHRHEAIWGGNPVHLMVGGVWLEYAASLAGERWSAPVFLASSDNILDVQPALAPVGSGHLIAVYTGDGRLRHEAIGSESQRAVFFRGGGVTVPGQAKNDLFAGVLPRLAGRESPRLEPAKAQVSGPSGPPSGIRVRPRNAPLDPDPEPRSIHPDFAEDLKRIRDYRIEVGGKSYRLLRGEFHRHTELSMDGGTDGSLEDMWRYAIDAAQLDWIGNGDHDSGGGRAYPWWIIQKTTDIFHHPPRFVPMFTYERSVPYPNGHRNVMFDRRGIRTLARLLGDDPGGVHPDDTKMLYAYLKQLGGICAVHTSGTGMGTDWRDNDRQVEPIVEIYQGDRNSYEALGAPRVARKQQEAIGGWRPLGMIWNALAMGYRLGFQASSDHWSTHISYAVAIAEDASRAAILDAFRKRHCYAATDNIVLDVRLGDRIMGDEFVYRQPQPPTLRVRVLGTAALERVDVIKDFSFAYSTSSDKSSIRFDWTDHDVRPGLSWYYVRVLQRDGQIAWGSPMWVRYSSRP